MSYFQTWHWASRANRKSKWLGAALRWLCGKATGHTASRTEWGYGGGPTVDVWCRWCNKPGSMPTSAAVDRFEKFRSTVWAQVGCDIKQQDWNPSPDAASGEQKTEGK